MKGDNEFEEERMADMIREHITYGVTQRETVNMLVHLISNVLHLNTTQPDETISQLKSILKKRIHSPYSELMEKEYAIYGKDINKNIP